MIDKIHSKRSEFKREVFSFNGNCRLAFLIYDSMVCLFRVVPCNSILPAASEATRCLGILTVTQYNVVSKPRRYRGRLCWPTHRNPIRELQLNKTKQNDLLVGQPGDLYCYPSCFYIDIIISFVLHLNECIKVRLRIHRFLENQNVLSPSLDGLILQTTFYLHFKC